MLRSHSGKATVTKLLGGASGGGEVPQLEWGVWGAKPQQLAFRYGRYDHFFNVFFVIISRGRKLSVARSEPI